jgi:calcium/calmodulin-dependent protein kinase I
LKLADFGLASKIDKPGEMLSGGGGTVGYAAPELIQRRPHSKPVDLWAVGCLVYVLLSGTHPFDFGEEEKIINSKVLKNVWSFSGGIWGSASAASKDIVKKMLVLDMNQRMTIDQALNHQWMKSSEDLGGRDMKNTLDELKAFKARRNFKKGVRAIMVSNMVQGMRNNSKANLDSNKSNESASSTRSAEAASGRSAAGQVSPETSPNNSNNAATATNNSPLEKPGQGSPLKLSAVVPLPEGNPGEEDRSTSVNKD